MRPSTRRSACSPRLVGLRPGALAASRALKPEIPQTGAYGVPLRDELEREREM